VKLRRKNNNKTKGINNKEIKEKEREEREGINKVVQLQEPYDN
jgi:hypothetical protein